MFFLKGVGGRGGLGMLPFLSALQAKVGFQKKNVRISGRTSTNFPPLHWLRFFPFTDEVNARVPSLLFHAKISHSQEQF